MAKILIEFLEDVDDEELMTTETLHFLISKIYVKAYGPRIRHQFQNKEINIEYNNIDELIKEFINDEREQISGNIC